MSLKNALYGDNRFLCNLPFVFGLQLCYDLLEPVNYQCHGNACKDFYC